MSNTDVRLIDANRFKRFLQAVCKAGAPYDEVIQLLDKEPTAYNVDVVVTQVKKKLDKLLYICDLKDVDKVYNFYDDVEDYIRKGGVE